VSGVIKEIYIRSRYRGKRDFQGKIWGGQKTVISVTDITVADILDCTDFCAFN
jgi:hypothetical protein